MFDSVEGDWREVALGQACRIAIGGTPSRDVPQYWSNGADGFPWASIADLRAPKLSETKEYISQDGIQNSNVKLVPRGTVVMSFKLTIGRTAIADRDIYTNEAIAAFTPNEGVDRDFLFYWLPYLAASAETDQAINPDFPDECGFSCTGGPNLA
jgi:type I restriction enzyme S subunit